MSEPARKIVPARQGNLPARPKRSLIDSLADGGFGRSSGKFIDFMPDVEAISQRRHSPFASLLVVFCCLFVAIAVGWMILFDVEQVVTAQGVARPASKVKLINHP